MTLPPIQRGGGMDIPPARPPLLTAPVLTGVPPLVDETELLLTGQPRTAGPRASGAPTPQPAPLPLRDDAPISLGGRLELGDQLPATTTLAVALESATRALQNGRADLVLSELDAVWSAKLGSDSPWYLRTAALQLLGRTDDAEQVLRDAVARLPRSAAMLYLLAVHTAHRGQFDAARLASDHALALHPTEPLLVLQRAALLQRASDGDAAARLLAQVLEHDPDVPAAQWLATLAKLGERAPAGSTPSAQCAVARLTPSSLPALVADDVTAPATITPQPWLDGAVRYGLSLLESPLQSARTATRLSGSMDAVTARAERMAMPVSLPVERAAGASWQSLAIGCAVLVFVAVPPLRVPAVAVLGVAVLSMLSRRQRG